MGTSQPCNMKFELARIIKKCEGLDELTLPFTHDEIDKVIREMPADRAPGPDGFIGGFFKKCWSITKDDLLMAINQLHSLRGDNWYLLNTAHIVLAEEGRRCTRVRVQANQSDAQHWEDHL